MILQVASRLAEAGVKGRSVTLKIKRRKEGAPEPSKFMGHGICDNLSRSLTLGRFIDSAADIAAEAGGLMRALRVPPCDMRGIGITVSSILCDRRLSCIVVKTVGLMQILCKSLKFPFCVHGHPSHECRAY